MGTVCSYVAVVVSAMATVVMAVFTALIWRAYLKTNRVYEGLLRAETRPSLTIRVQVSPLRLIVSNMGRGPATMRRLYFEGETTTTNLEETLAPEGKIRYPAELLIRHIEKVRESVDQQQREHLKAKAQMMDDGRPPSRLPGEEIKQDIPCWIEYADMNGNTFRQHFLVRILPAVAEVPIVPKKCEALAEAAGGVSGRGFQ